MSDMHGDHSREVEGEDGSRGKGMHPHIAARPDDHLLRVLVREHDVIRRWLGELESAVVCLEGASEATRPECIRRVLDAVERMRRTDLHRRREELVVYPACLDVSFDEVATALEGEHAEMKQKLAALTDEARAIAPSPAATFDRLLGAMRSFRFVYDNHMYKEDRVVFPLLANAIRDEGVWRRLHVEAMNCGALLDQEDA